MSDIERWVYFEGPEPESVRPLLDAMRAVDSTRPTEPTEPTDEEVAQAMESLLATLDARLGGARAWARERPEPTEGDGEGAAEERISAIVPSGAARRAVEATAAVRAEPALGFEAWAALSIRLIGAGAEEKDAALGARGLTGEAWSALDEAYLRTLSADLLAGRTERPALYAAQWNEEMGRRARVVEGEGEGERGEEEAGERAGERGEGATHPKPPVVRAPARMTGTGQAVVLPAATREAMARLPFREAPAGTGAGAEAGAGHGRGQGAGKTKPVPVMRNRLGETMPLGGDVPQKAVAIAAVPFAGSTGAAGVVWFPVLTVRQFVGLRIELATRPERVEETLRKYWVPSAGARRALEAHWRREMGERPEVRAEVDAAVGVYVEWLRGAVG